MKSPIKGSSYLITRGGLTDADPVREREDLLATIEMAVQAGISMIQIREKAISARSLFELTSAAALISRGSLTRLLVNDRADVALAAGADGVHLTALSLSAGTVRKSFPAGFLIGVSTHTESEVEEAVAGGADLVVYGPVFSSPGKRNALGLSALQTVCRRFPDLPVIGLGGIDSSNYRSVIDAGAAGVASIRWLNALVKEVPQSI